MRETRFAAWLNRFERRPNVVSEACAGTFGNDSFGNDCWPCTTRYRRHRLALAPFAPLLSAAFYAGLCRLRSLISNEGQLCNLHGKPHDQVFHNRDGISSVLRDLAVHVEDECDRRALWCRAEIACSGYRQPALHDLAGIDERVTILAGQISTWFTKRPNSMPTAFAAVREERSQSVIAQSNATAHALGDYVREIHPALRLHPAPAFSSTNIFFMAGEGDTHPKHVAYFMPEDEGIKRSPYKKTYYFANTHAAYIRFVSAPLYERHAAQDHRVDLRGRKQIPPLGVRAHEWGHCVHRITTGFGKLNLQHRWESVLLQEVAADVFGTLFLCEIWPDHFDYDIVDGVAYYIAECLRYVARGFGVFPDSDGMFLQLNYLARGGFVDVEAADVPQLRWQPDRVLAGLRALAVDLAQTVLDGNPSDALNFYRRYGPSETSPLQPMLRALQAHPPQSIEYVQEEATTQPRTAVGSRPELF